MKTLTTGQIVRHRGERKVIRQVYKNAQGDTVIEFVDRTKSINYSDVEFNGKK